LSEIEKRKKIESSLNKYINLFEAVIKQAPFAAHVIEGDFNNFKMIIENDESHKIMGECFKNITGIDADKSGMFKTHFFSIDGGTEIPLASIPLMRAFKGEIVKNEEFLFRHTNGKEISVEINASPIYDEEKNIIAVVITFQDISDRKNALGKGKFSSSHGLPSG